MGKSRGYAIAEGVVNAQLQKRQDQLHLCVQSRTPKGKKLIVVGVGVTKYMILLLQPNNSKKPIIQERHIINITSIVVNQSQKSVIFRFSGNDLQLYTEEFDALVKEVRAQRSSYTCGFPDFVVKLQTGDTIPYDGPSPSPSALGGLMDTYEACCRFFKVIPQKAIQECIDGPLSQTRSFVIQDAPFNDVKDPKHIHIQVLLNACWYNESLMAYCYQGNDMKDMIVRMSELVGKNTSATRLVVHDLDTNDGWNQLGLSLTKNSQTLLCEFSFRNCKIGDKNFALLGSGLGSLSHPIIYLDLSNCSLSGKGLQAFTDPQCVPDAQITGLQYLNLSYNKFEELSSSLLGKVLGNLNTSALQVLKLRKCNISPKPILDGLCKMSHIVLEHLDMAESKFSDRDAESMGRLLTKCDTLQSIVLDNCKISTKGVSSIFMGMSDGPCECLDISLRDCDLNASACASLARVLVSVESIGALDLSYNYIGLDGMTKIIDALSEPNPLHRLQFSRCVKTSNKKQYTACVTAFSSLLQRCRSLTSLDISGDGKAVLPGEVLSGIVTELCTQNRVLELDISGNKAGDSAMRTILSAVKGNSSLLSLSLDENAIGLDSLSSLRNAMANNTSICHVPYPEKDLMVFKKKGGGASAVRDMMKEVEECAERNAQKNSHWKDRCSLQDVKGEYELHVRPILTSVPGAPSRSSRIVKASSNHTSDAPLEKSKTSLSLRRTPYHAQGQITRMSTGGIDAGSSPSEAPTGYGSPVVPSFVPPSASSVDMRPKTARGPKPVVEEPPMPLSPPVPDYDDDYTDDDYTDEDYEEGWDEEGYYEEEGYEEEGYEEEGYYDGY